MENKDYLETPLWNSSRSLKERLDYLLGELTLNEKFEMMGTGCPNIPRLGITQFYLGGEAAHGIEARNDQAFNMGTPVATTSFPQPIGMSATWNTDLLEKIGVAVGNEARIVYNQKKTGGLCRWAPTIDMERDPRWGRTEEAYGEDPYLTGKMSSAYIRGMKGKDSYYLRAGATLKHFYANNVETDRTKISSSIDPRNKYEYYLESFKRAIIEGGAEGMMTAYNEINGIPCIVNDEVQKIVKDTWGLKGHIVCDGGDMMQTVNDHKFYGSHAETIANGLKAGVDCFTDNGDEVYKATKQAYFEGLITEQDLDRSIRNSFGTRIRLGIYDNIPQNPYANVSEGLLASKEHGELSLEATKETVVLLKNENSLLPLNPKSSEKLAVIGPLADVWYKDWYCGIPPYSVTPLEGIKNHFKESNISFSDGKDRIKLMVDGNYLVANENGTIGLGKKEDAMELIVTDWDFGSVTLQLANNRRFLCAIEEEELIKVYKEEAFAWFIKEAFNLKKQDDESYYIDSWCDQPLFINANGLLAAKMRLQDYSVTGGQSDDLAGVVRNQDNITPAKFQIEIISNGIENARNLAKNSDKVIVFLGSNPVINSKEEVDRTELALPYYQEQLLEAIYKENPNTVLVIVSNYPYTINWANDHIPAILFTASGSQELGNGIAEVLCGKYSPAGRLNMTWYENIHQLPDINDYDIIKGKRTYQYCDTKVLYPFGFGLSYAKFQYSNLEVRVKDFATVQVSAEVTNISDICGDEVIQVYVSKEKSRVVAPRKQLKAFKRIHLKALGKQVVIFEIPIEDLKYYDVITSDMVVEAGNYQFSIGANCEDIRLHKTICLEGQKEVYRNLKHKTLADHYDDYENAFLHIGNKGNTAVLPVNTSEEMILIYKDYKGSDEEEKVTEDLDVIGRVPQFVMDIKLEEQSNIEVFLNNQKIVKFLGEKENHFEEVRCEISKEGTSMLKTNDMLELKIIGKGKYRLSRFWFEF